MFRWVFYYVIFRGCRFFGKLYYIGCEGVGFYVVLGNFVGEFWLVEFIWVGFVFVCFCCLLEGVCIFCFV